MEAVFICKAFKDATTQAGDKNLAKQIWFIDVDKFALCVFNQFAYNQEIITLLAASFLLRLPEYYTPQHFLRKINLNTICYKIASLLFSKKADMDFFDQLIPLD